MVPIGRRLEAVGAAPEEEAMRHRFMWTSIAAMGIFLAAAVPAAAGEPTDQLRGTIDKVLAIVKNKDLGEAERQKLIRETAGPRFDWAVMARSAMGIYWHDRTPEQKEEFTKLFTDLVEGAYMDKIEGYSGEKIRYLGDSTDGGYGEIRVSIVTQKGEEIPITYRVMEEKGQWLIYDVVLEGVSLVNNYRTQIASIMNRSSYEDLVKKLREKVETKERPEEG